MDGSDGICAGYAHHLGAQRDCILYGPGMSGSCAAPNGALTFKEVCVALGTCASGAATELECGTCSDSSATKSNACATVSGTWTADAWTPTGIWELSAEEVCQPPSPEPPSRLRSNA